MANTRLSLGNWMPDDAEGSAFPPSDKMTMTAGVLDSRRSENPHRRQEIGTAACNGRWIEFLQSLTEIFGVARRWRNYLRIASKSDEPNLRSIGLSENFRRAFLRGGQAIGRAIFDEHAFADVDADPELGASRLHGRLLNTPLWPRSCNYEKNADDSEQAIRPTGSGRLCHRSCGARVANTRVVSPANTDVRINQTDGVTFVSRRLTKVTRLGYAGSASSTPSSARHLVKFYRVVEDVPRKTMRLAGRDEVGDVIDIQALAGFTLDLSLRRLINLG